MKLFTIKYGFLSVIFLCMFLSDALGQKVQDEIQLKQTHKTCGLLCLEYVYKTINGEKLTEPVNYSPISLNGLIKTAEELDLEPYAVKLGYKVLMIVNAPAILHFDDGHFVVYENCMDEEIKIYDPNIGQTTISEKTLLNKWSGKAIVFHSLLDSDELCAETIKSTLGFYDTPSVQGPVQGDSLNGGAARGDPTNSQRTGECSINGDPTGSPLLSITPITLNVTAQDIPLWYSTGVGPDIEIKLTYNANEKNAESGIGNQSTNFYPLGKMWTLNYASFYSLKTNSDVLVVGPDGRHDLYKKTANPQNPFFLPLGLMLRIFPVETGYTFVDPSTKYKFHYKSPYHSKLTSIEDRNGNVVSFQYDPNTFNLQKIIDAQGKETLIVTNTQGKITEIHDPFNRVVTFEYTGDYLTKITDMAGFASTLTYNNVPVFNGNSTTNEKRLVSVETPNGITAIDYKIINASGFNVEYNRITITNPDNNTHIYSWWPQSTAQGITKFVDYNGNEYQYYINVTSMTIEKVIYPLPESSVFYSYHSNGLKNSIAVGEWETKYEFDDRRNITKITDPRKKITLLDYDENDNLIEIKDPMNRITTFSYDDHSNLVGVTTPVNIIGFDYYPNGNLQDITDPREFVTSYTYDENFYLSQIIYPQGNPSLFVNDNLGRPVFITNNGVTLSYVYDSLNQVTQISYPDGTTMDFEYNFRQLVKITDRGGRIVENSYDNMNSLIQSIGPQGTINFERDKNGNLLNLSINGVTTSYQYDELDRVMKMTNPDGTSKHYTYDELGNLLKRLDENATLTTYSYNYNLLTQTDYADNTPDVEYTYNNNGELTSMTDGTGTTSYTYDNGGRLTYIDRPGTEGDMTYTYDNGGNRLSMNIPGMEVTYTYDSLSRLVDVESDYGTAAYQYDSKGNLKKKTYGNGTFTDYAYDELNRLVLLQNKKSTQEIFSGFNYTYDEASMIKTILDNEGNLSSYNYDYAYQLTEEKVEDPEGHFLWHDQFTYDNMGNRLTQNKNGIIDYYENNINNQLTSLKRQSNNVTGFIYGDTAVKVYVNNILANLTIFGDTLVKFIAKDIPLQFTSDTGYFVAYANGALAQVDDSSRFVIHTKKYPTGVINILVTNDTTGIPAENITLITKGYETIYYKYDPNGNMIARLTPFDTTNYLFDTENRLTKVVFPDAYFEEYEYDGFSQRVKVNLESNNQLLFYFDDLFQSVKVINDGGAKYVVRGKDYGGGINGIISESQEFIKYFYYNHRGDIINVRYTQDTNFHNSFIHYKAFGESYDSQKSSFFSSKEIDGQTNLYNFGYRYYVADIGKWNTRDPLRINSSINFYSFVDNNPINWLDMWGLFRFGKSRIGGMPWFGPFSSNPMDDKNNTEISHEHGFFEDGSGENVGFGPDGRFSEDPNGRGFHYDNKHYDDDIIREILKNFEDGDYSLLGTDGKKKNNCQDWADRLRKEYDKIIKEREKNNKNGCE